MLTRSVWESKSYVGPCDCRRLQGRRLPTSLVDDILKLWDRRFVIESAPLQHVGLRPCVRNSHYLLPSKLRQAGESKVWISRPGLGSNFGRNPCRLRSRDLKPLLRAKTAVAFLNDDNRGNTCDASAARPTVSAKRHSCGFAFSAAGRVRRWSFTIFATSASSCFASYTIPSLMVQRTPPTCSGLPVLSLSLRAPVP